MPTKMPNYINITKQNLSKIDFRESLYVEL